MEGEASILRLLEDARRRLVETGTRNRLVHVNRTTSRGNFLNVINERSDDVFRILRSEGKRMRFLGRGEEEPEQEDEIRLADPDEGAIDESRYVDSFLETPATPDGLQKRLLKLAKDSNVAEEEQGINILFLALGFLQWKESEASSIQREAPLILLPVELIRNNKTSTYDIKCREDDVVTNLSLQERLKGDFGIVLPEIDDSSEWVPSQYFAEVEEAISGRATWTVDRDGMQLGFFSFAKLMMLRDLDPENWSEGSLLGNPVLTGLLESGFEHEEPLFRDDDNLDDKIPMQRVMHVVDADASQTKVIEEVLQGRNLIVQGPPGTGKSQTITNILSAAAHEGKTVLFMAEKMAALEVVFSRMAKVGLRDLCLELHSRNANKKAVLEELAATISNSRSAEESTTDVTALEGARDRLNEIADALHAQTPERDYTPFQVLSELSLFMGRLNRAPRFNAEALEPISEHELGTLSEALVRFSELTEREGQKAPNPFQSAENLDLEPIDLQRTVETTRSLAEQLQALDTLLSSLRESLLLPQQNSVESAHLALTHAQHLDAGAVLPRETVGALWGKDWSSVHSEGIDAAGKWFQVLKSMEPRLRPAAWQSDLIPMRSAIAKGANSLLSRWFGNYRSGSNELGSLLTDELPKDPQQRLSLIDEIIAAQDLKTRFERRLPLLEETLGREWRGEDTDLETVGKVIGWFETLPRALLDMPQERIGLALSSIGEGVEPLTALRKSLGETERLLADLAKTLGMGALTEEQAKSRQLADLILVCEGIAEEPERYLEFVELERLRKQLLQHPVAWLISEVEKGSLSGQTAVDELRYALSEARWKHLRALNRVIAGISGVDRHALVERFQRLEREHVRVAQAGILSRHLAQVPKGSAGEMAVIRGEIAKKRRHIPIRRLITESSQMLQRIKPIFLMSPISVAQFLPPGRVNFDLLVIDEASQVRPEDALGAIARAKQIVVVGDQKQLPPTSFFDRLTENSVDDEPDDDEDAFMVKATEMESVLSLCEARGLGDRMLEWHYRSRDPSLITVSNLEFYKNRLVLPPSPTLKDEEFGLRLRQVAGVYSSATKGGGRPRTNRIEAEHVVARLCEIAETRVEFSVGIVTFSKSQADMVTEILELKRRTNPVLDAFLREDKNERVFVKNIENVQGDERDIILVSVCYGPHEANGRLHSMSFGPVNSEGGERRLNVLFSRARVACEVFTSFAPDDIDLSRTTKEGPKIFKKFLKFAETGELIHSYQSEGEADTPFEDDVAEAIRSMGYAVDHQVGTAGFKIDLGVKVDESSLHHSLAVECDGASYHSSLWARERDRMRQEVLEGFGWRFHRIWSTDWFYKREQEIKRLQNAIEEAIGLDPRSATKGANALDKKASPTKDLTLEVVPQGTATEFEEQEFEFPKYTKARVWVGRDKEPHERTPSEVGLIVKRIVEAEGPIHADEVARRYASAHGKTRVGSRISDAVMKGLRQEERNGDIVRSGKFWATKEQMESPPIRNRSAESPPTTNFENISPMELKACIEFIRAESGAVPEDEMPSQVAKLLGFKRAGSEIQAAVRKLLR